jgi:hypothetical protein
LQWYKIAHETEPAFDLWQYRVSEFLQNVKITPSGNTTTITTTMPSPTDNSLDSTVKIQRTVTTKPETIVEKPISIVPEGSPAGLGINDAIVSWNEAVNDVNKGQQVLFFSIFLYLIEVIENAIDNRLRQWLMQCVVQPVGTPIQTWV